MPKPYKAVGASKEMPIRRPLSSEIRILVVDDEHDFAEMTAEMLEQERAEFSVSTETDPTGVLDALDDDIDCVVSDYEMPAMDGVELLGAVRERYPALPFILFTGHGSEKVASDAISAGVTDYLQKGGSTDQYEILAQRITNAVEKQRAEQVVEQSVQAIETATAGISLLDEDGEFVYVNEAYADIYGYDREELLGSHWERLYRDDDINEVYESILPEARDGVWSGESTHLDKQGNAVITDHTVTYADEETLVCTVEDVTREKKATDELELKERAMDAAPIGVTIADATREDNPLVYVNDGFEDLTGYSRDDVLGRNCRFLQGGGTSAESVAALRDAIENEKPVTVELRNYRREGTEFWNRVSIAPIRDEDGTITHYVGFQEDVTERKQIEREADALLEQFKEFGSVLSHDLQKPLSKARGQIKLARRTNDWDELDRADEYLERVTTLISDFAEVMRDGQIVSDVREIDVGAISEAVWEHFPSKSATLELVDDPEITGDEQALRRLLENLFQNACDHSDGDVRVRVGALPDGFYVADDGSGIPEKRRDDVFSPGYTTHDDGAGMGLASVKQIVLAHGWEIAVTDGQWGGARFEITTDSDSIRSHANAEQMHV